MKKHIFIIKDYIVNEWNRYVDSDDETPEYIKQMDECGSALEAINKIIDILGY